MAVTYQIKEARFRDEPDKSKVEVSMLVETNDSGTVETKWYLIEYDYTAVGTFDVTTFLDAATGGTPFDA